MFSRVRDKDRDNRLDEYRQSTSDRVSRLEGEHTSFHMSVAQRMDRMDADFHRLRTDFSTSVTRLETILEERFARLDNKIDDLTNSQTMVSGIGVAVKWVIIIGGSSGVIGGVIVGAARLLGGAHL